MVASVVCLPCRERWGYEHLALSGICSGGRLAELWGALTLADGKGGEERGERNRAVPFDLDGYGCTLDMEGS